MDNVVEALIEIPLHSKNKYEVDNATGKIKLDRVIYASMVYPTEYGIIENTLAPDGDPLDILVVSDYPSFPGCYVPARVLGYLEMTDGGKPDRGRRRSSDPAPRAWFPSIRPHPARDRPARRRPSARTGSGNRYPPSSASARRGRNPAASALPPAWRP